MGRVHAEHSALIDAPAEDIYRLIADYRDGHPKMLPEEHFKDLRVAQGGSGAGTVINFVLRAGGADRPYRMAVTEPQPGRVLRENDTASDLKTTFTVDPVDGGRKARVTIATDWEASSGLKGLIEKVLYPPAMRRIYEKELRQLAAVMSGATPLAQR